MEGQKKSASMMEVCCNIFAGMVLAFCLTQFFLIPILGMEISLVSNVYMTIILTVVSVIRGYIFRRIFNYLYLKKEDEIDGEY